MRRSGTYGSHLEISVFAKVAHSVIKIIQPGLIYSVGNEDESPSPKSKAPASATASTTLPTPSSSRVTRKQAKGKAAAEPIATSPNSSASEAVDATETANPNIYLAYHAWEQCALLLCMPMRVDRDHSYSSVRNLAGPHTGKPQISIEASPDSSKAKGGGGSSTSLIASADEKLLMASLANPAEHTLSSIREAIHTHGTWERALEALQQEDLPSDASSPLTSSPSSSRATSPAEASSTVLSDRPQSPKRTLSESMSGTTLQTPTRKLRLTLATDNEPVDPPSPSSSTSSLLSEVPDSPAAEAPSPSPAEKEKEAKKKPAVPVKPAEPRYATRSRTTNGGRPVLTARAKRDQARARKHELR